MIKLDSTTISKITAQEVIGRQLKGPLSNLLTDYQSQIGGNLQTQQIPNEFKINFLSI